MWDCNEQAQQTWVYDTDSQTIRYLPNSLKCIDVPGGDFTNGNKLQLWDCNDQVRGLGRHLRAQIHTILDILLDLLLH